MKKILILGAGRSSSALISYMVAHAPAHDWTVTVGDTQEQAASERIGAMPRGNAIRFDIQEPESSRYAISNADIVISLIPAHLHPQVARICLAEKKHLLTASYVSDEMKALHDEAVSQDILLLNECGLDPGIDHMSAMKVIDQVKASGGKLLSFESFTGGLIAPETEPENPWRYKFTWNPRNVVMAGQGTARFLDDGKFKFIPYQQLFVRTTPVVVPGFGEYEGYANRDSLKYLQTYNLHHIKTMLRGTLRNKGYCAAWNVLVQLGCCDDSFQLEGVAEMSHCDFMGAFLKSKKGLSTEERLCLSMGLSMQGEEMKRLRWSGLFTDEKVGLQQGTPAQVLEHILNKRWKLKPGDKDFIVMWHRFRFEQYGRTKEIQAHLTVTGSDEVHTAMARTVGLPLGISAKLVLEGKIKSRGVVIPVTREIYNPVLAELATHKIELTEREVTVGEE